MSVTDVATTAIAVGVVLLFALAVETYNRWQDSIEARQAQRLREMRAREEARARRNCRSMSVPVTEARDLPTVDALLEDVFRGAGR